MIEEISKYLFVFGSSMVKFIFGPVAGTSMGFSYIETVVLTALGMMTSVIIITVLSEKIKEYRAKKNAKNKKKKFSKRSRQFVKIWSKYGIWGVSMLTPLIFTPIGGALLINAVGAPPKKIIPSMLVSAIFWSAAITFAVRFILPDLKHFI
ncbi:hypothetical protein [Marinigracilibium pacificum]|uniref:Small multi-drug export protein n=1 Tax=Marinigracilibium pacificum TaxID=2729599 RepID=A0A848J2K0_9BACT|nr:hypothetical protein [Marinigracilibium pacificum]NMM48714.1 hypothetical protein [Marinigracilibium pacificum]